MKKPKPALNSEGFTLLEAMLAIGILAFIMLWTLQAMLSAYDIAARNRLRNEGVRLAGEELTDVRNTPYATLLSIAQSQTPPIPPRTEQRRIRNFNANYTITRTVTAVVVGGGESLACSVLVVVNWFHKGAAYNCTVSTIVADK